MFKKIWGYIRSNASGNSVIGMWVKSIAALICVSILLILAFYMTSYAIFRRNAENTYRMLLDQVATSIDLQINEAQKSLHKLLQDYDTAKIAQSENVNDISLTTNKMQLIEQMKAVCQLNGFIDDILLYFPRQDYIISSSTLSGSAISYYASYKEYVSDYQQWRDMFLEHETGDLFIMSRSKEHPVTGDSNVLYYIYESRPLFGSEPVMAFFSVEGSILSPQISAMSADSDVDIALMLSDGTVFVSNNGSAYEHIADDEGILSALRSGGTAISTLPLASGDAFVLKSEHMDLNYVIYVRDGYAAYIQTPLLAICVAAFVLIIIVAISTILRYSREAILPLIEIRSMLSSDNLDKEDSELKQIRDAIYASNAQVATISSELNVNQVKLQRSYLQTLLLRGASKADGAPMLEELQFGQSGFAVMMFAPIDSEMPIAENTEAAVFLVLRYEGVLKPMQRAGIALKWIMFDDAFVIAANLDERDADRWASLADASAHDVVAAWDEQFDARLAYAYSGVNVGEAGLAQSYAESRLAMRYKLLSDFERAGDMRYGREGVRYFFQTSERNRLMNLLKSGSAEELERFIDELWQENSNGEFSDILLDCFSNDVAGAIMSMSVTAKMDTEAEREFLKHLAYMQKQRPEYRRASLVQLSAIALEQISAEKDCEQARFYEKIERFVQEHYADPALSVESICTHFGRSHNSVYSAVKARSGEGVLHLINCVRLCRAKELLLQPGATVEKTAQAVGLNSSLALFRIFKRYEGLTPTQYISQNK